MVTNRKFGVWLAGFLILFAGCGSMGRAGTDATWFPFTVPWDDASVTATDVSRLTADAPAGKHGFLTVRNGHFYFEDGIRIRFWGANLSIEGNFPPRDTAEKLAGHLAKTGFNIIRLHHLDSNYAPLGIFDRTNRDTRTFSPEQLDRLDYLIYQLKSKGIYVDINLHVGRKFTAADGVADAKNLPRNSKQVTLFNRKLIDLQKDYATKLLMHYNPYTKTRYNQEPAVALVETTNENTLFTAWTNGALFGLTDEALPQSYREELDRLWNEWLRRQYQTEARLRNSWDGGKVQPGPNLLINADFEQKLGAEWVREIHKEVGAVFQQDAMETAHGKSALRVDINRSEGQGYQLQLKQLGLKLAVGQTYTLSFLAKSDWVPELNVSYGLDREPWTNLGLSQRIELSSTWQRYRINFKPRQEATAVTRVAFVLGKSAGRVWLDDLQLTTAGCDGLLPTESLAAGNIGRTPWPERFTFTEARLADDTRFYYELERDYFTEMKNFLRQQLKVRVPVSSTNNYYGQPNLIAQNVGDYIDCHAYWDHPSFPDKRFDPTNFRQHNRSLVANNQFLYNPNVAYNASPLVRLALSAVGGKPLVVSEWNAVFPNDYDYEEAGLLPAYGGLQDWDGFFIYTLCHRVADLKTDNINSWFNVINNPGKMAQMPAAAVAFINGYFRPAFRDLKLRYRTEDVWRSFREQGLTLDYGLRGRLPLGVVYQHQVRKVDFQADRTSAPEELLTNSELTELQTAQRFTGDTGETVWDMSVAGQERVAFNAPRFQGAVGFIGGQTVRLTNLELRLENAASAWLVPLDGNELARSKRLLLTIVGPQRNTGQMKNNQNGLADWGKPPVLLQTIRGTVAWQTQGDWRAFQVYALDHSGQRLRSLPTTGGEGWLRFTVGHATPWYEIGVRETVGTR